MKTLSSALSTVYGGPVQRPGWLVEIGFSVPLRLSSQGTVSYGGYTWVAADVDVSRVRVEAASVGGSIVLGNADDLYGAIVLNEGASDKPIRIFGFDAGATASADIVPMVNCVGGKASVGAQRVTIALRDGNAYVYAPRTFVGPVSGFNQLLAAGTVLNLNGQSYRIER